MIRSRIRGERATATATAAIAIATATATATAAAAAAAIYYYWDDPIGQAPRVSTSSNLHLYRSSPLANLPVLGDAVLTLVNLHRIHDLVTDIVNPIVDAHAAVSLNKSEHNDNNDNDDGQRDQGVVKETGVLANGKPGAAVLKLPFQPPWILIGDPESVEHVLKVAFTTYDKGPYFYSRTRDVLGHGIFAVDGEEWRHQRKTAANIFNIRVINTSFFLSPLPLPLPFLSTCY